MIYGPGIDSLQNCNISRSGKIARLSRLKILTNAKNQKTKLQNPQIKHCSC